MAVWQVVLHAPYDDIKVLKLEECADNILICQHEADDGVNRTHCHVMLDGVKVSDEAIRKRINKHGLGGRGNYAIIQRYKSEAYDTDKLGVYVLKGKLANMKQTSYESQKISAWVDDWRESVSNPSDKSPPKNGSKSPVKSHYDIMEEILQETRQRPGIWRVINTISSDEQGLIQDPVWVCENRKAVWDCMIKHLAKNKIRTSKHELERWYVTMMREEKNTSEAMYSSIMRKLYSDV